MFSSLSFLSFFVFCSFVCIVHPSNVCILNAVPLLNVRPSLPTCPTCRDPCGSLFLHPLATASLLQHEVETTQIESPNSPHSRLLTITGMSILLTFLFFFTDQVTSALLTHPHLFTYCSTSCTYHFNNSNVHPCLHTISCHAPPLPAVLLAVRSLSVALSTSFLHCLLTSPCISHHNDMQHLCVLARCMPQMHSHGVRVSIQVVSGASLCFFLSFSVTDLAFFFFFSLHRHQHQRYTMD